MQIKKNNISQEESKKLYEKLPTCPGVYIMRDVSDRILYIGKSGSIKSRVRSYFLAKTDLNFAKKSMVKQIHHIDYIETKTEIEALMLETNMIKEHQPKYNILMKDGKNLSYITISNGPIPCLTRTRFKKASINGSKGSELYFGPYSQYFDTWKYIRLVRKIFRLGNHDSLEKFGAPCMDYFLGLCPGHCTGEREKISLYLQRLEKAKQFLAGNHTQVRDELTEKMNQFAREKRFEEAGEYKEQIAQIDATGHTQIVRDIITGDAVVIVSIEKYGHVFLAFVEIKHGSITGIREYRITSPLAEDTKTQVTDAIFLYLEEHEWSTIYTDFDLSQYAELRLFCQQKKIQITTPKRGEKVQLLEFAHTNLLNFAFQEEMSGFKSATLSKGTMISLLNILFLKQNDSKKNNNILNSRLRRNDGKEKKEIIFECFDISHSHGEHTVASKSVLVNGKPDPKRYKKYRIKTLKTGIIDDFASMTEILTRRTLAALRGEDPWPDLIVIDGGKGQLSHALQAIQNTGDMPIGMSSNKIQNEGIIKAPLSRGGGNESEEGGLIERINGTQLKTRINGINELNKQNELNRSNPEPPIISLAKRIEEVFVPGKSEPILLEKGSPELMILQKIRDEAHRFAINYNRSSREKGYTKTIFDEIPGIGPSTRRKILREISTIEELSSWSYEKAKKYFGKRAAEALQDHGLLMIEKE